MRWLEEHPDIRDIRCGAVDLNGQARGKRIPLRFAEKIERDGLRFPLSVLNLDIWGADIDGSPLVFETGDPDGTLRATERGYVPMPWLAQPTALLPVWMFTPDGAPFAGDPRHALAKVVDRYAARGLCPVVATEMEFTLVDDSGPTLQPPRDPRSGHRDAGPEILSLKTLDAYDGFFSDLYAACEAMNIPAEAAISEAGLGQFEITLEHVADALKAADDAWLFKMLVRGIARNHGMAASFIAKPYADQAGNGMHTHFSLIDSGGRNVMANDSFEGAPLLQNAIAGCLAGITDLTLIFAPHKTSYDRLVPNSHAPTSICWAYDNRTASLRVPDSSYAARRLEHRVAGGDVNPYLFLAAVLGSALVGIEGELTPPPPITGSAYGQDLPQIPGTWSEAIDTFENSAFAARVFDQILIDNLVMTKRQELRETADLSPKALCDLYLERV